MNPVQSLHEHLRSATAEVHERLEKLPFLEALQGQALPRQSVLSLYRSLSIIHAVLERSLDCMDDRRLPPFVRGIRHKLPLLLADLKTMRAEEEKTIVPAIRHALSLGSEIMKNASSPARLMGTLYVLEGSQNGAMMLKSAYARHLNLESEELSYFGCYGRETRAVWQSFVDQLNRIDFTDAEKHEAGEAAKNTFAGFEKIYSALYPYASEDLSNHVSTLNPEAGDHAIPEDPKVIELALRAGRKAWNRYPYLKQRFGERGERFTSSDSCWLAVQYLQSPHAATRSLQWLRTVLSTRGLPTIILEDHLKELNREFDLLNGKSAESSSFDPFLLSLADERKRFFNDQATLEMHLRNQLRFKNWAPEEVLEMSRLITSAWMDEKSGRNGALSSTLAWFTDTARYSAEWIILVHQFVSELDQN